MTMDMVVTYLFTLECLINIIVYGLICNGKHSYLRDNWNVMDFLIVTTAVTSLVLQSSHSSDHSNLGFLNIVKMLRILRPFRMLKRNVGLQT